MPTKEGLIAEGALILEQEGWLLVRASDSSRMRAFAQRYVTWQQKVQAWRAENPTLWPEPSDNS